MLYRDPGASTQILTLISVVWTLGLGAPILGLAASCPTNPKDPYDTGHLMQASRYRGECADIEKKRPAKILSEDDQFITFANLRHDDRWWTAQLPKKSVEKVTLAVRQLHLPPMIQGAHAELRFILKKGAEMQLTAQSPEPGKPDHDTLNDVMWSMEYVAPPGVEYSAFVGILESYDAVDRIVSTRDQALDQIKSGRHPVQQWLLRLKSPQDGDLLLQKGIHQSQEMSYSQTYYTLSVNCNSALFQLLDLLPDKTPGLAPYEIHWYRYLRDLNDQYADDLQLRGLIASSTREPDLATLNDELLISGQISKPH